MKAERKKNMTKNFSRIMFKNLAADREEEAKTSTLDMQIILFG